MKFDYVKNMRVWIIGVTALLLACFGISLIVGTMLNYNSELTIDYAATGPDVKPAMEYAEEVDGIVGYGEGERSGHWPTVMHHFRNNQYATATGWATFNDGVDRSVCRCCGSSENLNVHHIQPFHINPALECDPTNLVTLCRDHHFHIGHRDNWKNSNPNVCADCDRMRAKLNPR